MESPSAFVGILINLVVPFAGIALYLWLLNRMNDEHPSPVVVFLLFTNYGAWLVTILTIKFWYWSGMASLGIMCLVTVGTVVMVVLSGLTFRERNLSIYHCFVFIAAVAGIIPTLLMFTFISFLLMGQA